jgi:hypothetical protein
MPLPRSFTRAPLPLAAFLFAACAHSAVRVDPGPFVTDRPDFTESAFTVAKGYTQLEIGATSSRESGERGLAFGETLVRAGVASGVEVRVSPGSYLVEGTGSARVEGFEDAGVSMKLGVHEGPGTPGRIEPTLALLVGTSLPTGAQAFRGPRALPLVKLIAAWSLTDRLALGSNVNWASAEAAGTSGHTWSGSASFGYAFSGRVGGFAEYYAIGDQLGAWQRRSYVDGGLTYLLREGFQVDLRFGVRADGPGDGSFAGLGLARRF